VTAPRWSAPWLAAAGGACLLVAHPPTGVWPLTVVVVPLLVLALRATRLPGPGGRGWVRVLLTASALGTLAGLVAYGPMLRWLIAPAGLLGWGLLALIQAVWVGVWAAFIRPWVRSPWLAPVAALTWTGMDAWRALVPLSGFEWGSIAYAHAADPFLLPVARTLGARGITFLVVLFGVALLEVLVAWRAGAGRPRGRTVAVPLILLVVVIALRAVPPPPTQGSLDVLVVQANDIRHWVAPVSDPPLTITTTARDLTLAAVERGGPPDLTVWPESSIDRDPSRPSGAPLGLLAAEASRAAGTIVAGASLDGPDPSTQRAIVALQLQDGPEVDRYVKRRLVPFGEYVPLRRVLGRIPALDQIQRDAVAGTQARSLEVASGVRAAVVICFETLFADIVRTNVLAGPTDAGLVLAITNDASFQDSAEPAQHLAQSRLRAVETGRWVVHGALSGSSAFVAPDGSVSDATSLFTATTIRREVPLAVGSTPFLLAGDVVGALARAGFVASAVAVVIATRRRRAVSDRPSSSER
jgi:apolipoprotein N-acyltransferase